MTATTCACGTYLKESYPAAIVRHGETKKHQAWLGTLFDEVPLNVARRDDEPAASYLKRLEDTMDAKEFTLYIASDAGQRLMGDVADEDKETRKTSRKAALHIDEATGATVLTPTPTAAIPATYKRMTVEAVEGIGTPIGATVLTPKIIAEPGDGLNKPLKIGSGTIVVGDLTLNPILHRDGSIAGHQTDNYIWRCPSCKQRVRAAEHHDYKAPFGYRVSDRIVK